MAEPPAVPVAITKYAYTGKRLKFTAPVAFFDAGVLPAICLISGVRENVEFRDYVRKAAIQQPRRLFEAEKKQIREFTFALPIEPQALRRDTRRQNVCVWLFVPFGICLYTSLQMWQYGKFYEHSWIPAGVLAAGILSGCIGVPFLFNHFTFSIDPASETLTLNLPRGREEVYAELTNAFAHWRPPERPAEPKPLPQDDDAWTENVGNTWDQGPKQ